MQNDKDNCITVIGKGGVPVKVCKTETFDGKDQICFTIQDNKEPLEFCVDASNAENYLKDYVSDKDLERLRRYLSF